MQRVRERQRTGCRSVLPERIWDGRRRLEAVRYRRRPVPVPEPRRCIPQPVRMHPVRHSDPLDQPSVNSETSLIGALRRD
jgi:hypothetical protein